MKGSALAQWLTPVSALPPVPGECLLLAERVAALLQLLVAPVSRPRPRAGPAPRGEEERPQQEAAQQQGPPEQVGGVEGEVVRAAAGEDGPLLPRLLLLPPAAEAAGPHTRHWTQVRNNQQSTLAN